MSVLWVYTTSTCLFFKPWMVTVYLFHFPILSAFRCWQRKEITQCYRMLLLKFRVSSLNWQCFYIFLFCRIYFSPFLLRICLIALQNLAQMFLLLKISMVFIGLWLLLTVSVVRNLIVVSVTLNCDSLLTSLWTAFWGYDFYTIYLLFPT